MIPIKATKKFAVFDIPAIPPLILDDSGKHADNPKDDVENGWYVKYKNSLLQRENIFQQLYFDCPTSRAAYASLQERQTSNDKKSKENSSKDPLTRFVKSTLTYGEVTSMEVVNSIIEVLVEENLIYTPNNQSIYKKKMPFYDLGSGCGKVVFSACLTGFFSLCCGIELLTSLHEISLASKQRYELERCRSKESIVHQEVDSELLEWNDTDVEFYAGDFTQLTAESSNPIKIRDWRRGVSGEYEPVFIFMNSTCFDDQLMSCIEEMISADNIAKDSIVITLSQPFVKKSTKLEIIREIRKDMSWGMADIFIHKKL